LLPRRRRAADDPPPPWVTSSASAAPTPLATPSQGKPAPSTSSRFDEHHPLVDVEPPENSSAPCRRSFRQRESPSARRRGASYGSGTSPRNSIPVQVRWLSG